MEDTSLSNVKIEENTHALASALLEEFNSRNIKLAGVPSHKRIFIFLFTRALKTYLAIQTLCRQGYGQDIATLVRSLLENLVSARYILCDPRSADEKATRFVDYKWIVFRRYISNGKQDPAEIKDILTKKLVSKKDVVLEKVEAFKEKYKVKSDKALVTWSGRSVRDMAKRAAQSLLKEYDDTFRLSSRFSHPSIIGDRAYIKYIGNDMTFSPFPSATGVYANFRIAIHYMADFLGLFNDLFQLGFNARIEQLKTEVKNLPEEETPNIHATTAADLNKDDIVIKFEKPS